MRITHRRIHELIEQYGLEAFQASQEEIIDYVERVVRKRLRDMPDGSWADQIYHDHDGRNAVMYPMRCKVTKTDDRLVVDMTGTAPQAPGAINCARPAMEGAVLGVFLTFLCYDLPWAVDAGRRIIEIVSEEGTLNNALSPAGVSMASIMTTLSTQDVVANAFAKMLMASDELGTEAQACWSPGINCPVMAGLDRHGEPFAARLHGLLRRRRGRADVHRRDRHRRDPALDVLARSRTRRRPRAARRCCRSTGASAATAAATGASAAASASSSGCCRTRTRSRSSP